MVDPLLHNVVMLLVFYTVLHRHCALAAARIRTRLDTDGILHQQLLADAAGAHVHFPNAVHLALAPQPLPDELWYLAATVIIIAVIAPIAEEFVFRGVILHWLIASSGLWKGIGLSSLISSIFHINILGAFLFALVALIVSLVMLLVFINWLVRDLEKSRGNL